MASYYKENGKYHVRFRWNGKQVHLTRNTSRERDEAEIEYKVKHKEKIDENKVFKLYPTFSEVYQEFKIARIGKVKESTLESYENSYKNHFPMFYNLKINEITEKHIDEFHSYLENKNLKFASKDKNHSFLVAILNFAKSRYRLPDNPASAVGGFINTEEKQEMLFWTEEEFMQFIGSVDDLLDKVFFSCLYLTGCRKGEVYALLWEDISFKNKTLRITKTLSRHTLTKDRTFRITSPKSKSRTISIPEILLALFSELKKSFEKEAKVNGKDYVFGIAKPRSDSELLRRKNNYCSVSEVKQIRMHDIRHSHVSLLINKSIAMKNPLQIAYIIAERIGDRVEEIFKTYGHLFPKADTDIINNLNLNIG